MNATVTQKPKRVKLNSAELCKQSADKLRELYGPRTFLGKHDVQCEKPWQILTFVEIGKTKTHASGDSAREALENANLAGWLEDLERGLIK